MLHVTNGDCTTEILGRTGLEGDLLAWADVLHDGPVPLGGPEELRTVRAAFLASQGWAGEAQAYDDLRRRDERLARALRDGEPTVLWFEHDLYDQLQLLQVLDAIDDEAADVVQLVLVGTFPGRPRFAGLGELTPDELASLWPLRVPVTAAQRARARRAWRRFRAGDLDGLAQEARAPADGLPYLGAALERLLQEVPGSDGLGRTERELLAAVQRGAATPVEAFLAAARREEAPFLGDGSAFARLVALAAPPCPLLDVEGGRVLPGAAVRLTAEGHEVAAGRAARVPPDGLERWIGGARL